MGHSRRFYALSGVSTKSGDLQHPDARSRVDVLTRRLGLRPPLPPLDATEFVAKHFVPNSLVYIEDPFGKTPAEYTTSLHTYSFFDIAAFLKALGDASPRASARVLITSREGLFERWQSEVGRDAAGGLSIVRLQATDYQFSQRLTLTRVLLNARGRSALDIEAKEIARGLETPFEIEQCVYALPTGAAGEAIKSAVAEARQLTLFLLEATYHNDCRPPKLPFPHREARIRLESEGRLHWQNCEILSREVEGAIEHYTLRCPFYQKGVIRRDRDVTPGFKEASMSECPECGLTGDGFDFDLDSVRKNVGA
jgi:hypothetical protein